jgi:hypothetical protein
LDCFFINCPTAKLGRKGIERGLKHKFERKRLVEFVTLVTYGGKTAKKNGQLPRFSTFAGTVLVFCWAALMK